MNARMYKGLLMAAVLGALAAGCAWQPSAPLPRSAAAEALYLVGHPELQLRPSQARDAYLDDAASARDAGLVLVDNAPLLDEFLRKLLKVERAQYEKVWQRRAFRDGTEPPPRLEGDAAVNDFVRRTPGAVGYVRAPGSRVKVLGKL